MQREIMIQALQSEGVIDAVIFAALVKAEMWNMESRIMYRMERAMENVRECPNVFEAQAMTLQEKVGLRRRMTKVAG